MIGSVDGNLSAGQKVESEQASRSSSTFPTVETGPVTHDSTTRERISADHFVSGRLAEHLHYPPSLLRCLAVNLLVSCHLIVHPLASAAAARAASPPGGSRARLHITTPIPPNRRPPHSSLFPSSTRVHPHDSNGISAVTAQRHTSASMPSATSEPGSGKRVFSSTSKNSANGTHSTGQKIKNFFRLPSKSHANNGTDSEKGSLAEGQQDGARTPQSTNNKSSLRNSRFLPHIGRSRSTTVASEGNPLDDAMSPTAHANPYFQHQGPPALRHHDDSSIPPSPPDTPTMSRKISPENAGKDANGTSGKEELARKLRRVASAPNAQGLFNKGKDANGDRPPTADTAEMPMPKINGMGSHANASTLSMVETMPANGDLLPVPGIDGAITPGKLRNSIAFRRTYSSNSIKVRNVEVGPSSFDKIKLIGKGDVGKVYLVREKKSSRLYAMKGQYE